MGEIDNKDGTKRYDEDIKNKLRNYHSKPDKRNKLYDELFNRNKNKLLLAMLRIFDAEINNFSYEDTEDISYLFSLMYVLPNIIDKNQLLQQTVINRFNTIHREINDLLHKTEMSKTSRYKMLDNIRNKMEDTILKFSDKIPADYDPEKGDYISYLIFEAKNINYIENAIEEYPYLVNIKDKDGIPLINKVLDIYLRSLSKYTKDKNLGPIDDLIYYKKILKILLDSPKISLNEDDKKVLLDKLNEHLKNSNHEVIRQKEKHTYFINSIIMMILGIEEENSLNNLNYEYEVHDTFKATHELEAKRIYILNKDIKGKRKKRRIYTFDGEGAFELDDALSIEKKDGVYKLGVHIANPIAYIPTNSILYDEARKRTRSLYFGSECIPMIPFNLSGDIMSLNEGEYRHAMSHYFYIDAENGDLLKYDIEDEIIKVTKNMTYTQFNEAIEHGSDDEVFMETLLDLCSIAPMLAKVYDEDSVYQEFHNDNSRTIGTSVVEKCMIYTNHNLAKRFAKDDLPFIYRCHTMDDKQLKRIDELKAKLPLRAENKYLFRDYEMLKSIYPRAYYTTENVGHMGLGTSYYSHVTSPLRRFADNVAGECIYKFILNKYTSDDLKAYKEYIQKMAENINAKRKTLDNYEIERVRRLYKTEGDVHPPKLHL